MSQARTLIRRRKFQGQQPAAEQQKKEGTQARVGFQPIQRQGLTVGKPNDAYEAEADHVADQVVNGSAGPGVQRKCAACEKEDAKRMPLAAGVTPLVQRQEEEEPAAKPMLQRQEEEEPAAQPLVQRMEEEEPAAKPMLQRQEEEEPAAQPLVQRMEEEEPAAKPMLQRQEEEEPAAQPLVQRQEEEEPAAKPMLQRQEEEEPAAQPMVQRQEEEEEPAAQPLVQRMEEEEPAAKPMLQRQEEEEPAAQPLVQRQEEEEPAAKPMLQRQEEEEPAAQPLVQRMEEEEPAAKPMLQRQEEEEPAAKPASTQPSNPKSNDPAKQVGPPSQKQAGVREATPWATRKIAETRGMGSPLPKDTRRFMEQQMGADLGKVRVHNDDLSHQLSQNLHAQAFTVGHDVYFNRGYYNPNTKSGQHLLAHELTHTLQQKGWVQKQAAPAAGRNCSACPNPVNPQVQVDFTPSPEYVNLGIGSFGFTPNAGLDVTRVSVWQRERETCNSCGPDGNETEWSVCPRKIHVQGRWTIQLNPDEINRTGPNGEQWFQDCNNPFDRQHITPAQAVASMANPQRITVRSTRVHERFHVEQAAGLVQNRLAGRNDIETLCGYDGGAIARWKSGLENTLETDAESFVSGGGINWNSIEGAARTHECANGY